MALIDDLTDAQAQWLHPLRSKRLLIRTPIALLTTFSVPASLYRFFDPTHYDGTDTDDYVYLTLFPQYESESEAIVERKYQPTFSRGAIAFPSTVRHGFRAVVDRQPDMVFFKIVEQLVEISETSSSSVHSPVKAIDFCLPESSGNTNVTSEGDLGSIRYGRIDITKRPSGSIRWEGRDYAIAPWEFSFREAKLRF